MVIGLAVVVVAAVLGAVLALVPGGDAAGSPASQGVGAKGNDIKSSWDEQDYQAVISLAEQSLKDDPLSYQTLLYRGYASFYHGLSQPDVVEKTAFLSRATVDLRKALVIEPYGQQNSDIYYVLGKAYYHRGYFYQELSLEYLKKAGESGCRATDLNEYLGLVSSALGDTKAAIDYFKKAITEDPRDIVLLSLSTAYMAIDDLSTAMEYVDRIIGQSKDVVIVQKARFIKGDILTKQDKTGEAIAEYESILRDNPNSADAHFYLGEVYAATGDTVKARAQWREAYNIDSKHAGAISRLNS